MKKCQFLNIALVLLLVISLFGQSACSELKPRAKRVGDVLVIKGDPTQAESDEGKTSREIEAYFIKQYTTSKGIDLDSMLSALGAVSGFGCQMAVREAIVDKHLMTEKEAFYIVSGKDGKNYYFGDQLNQPLLEVQMSVRSQILGAAKYAGAKEIPDAMDIVKYNAETVGKSEFGIPRLTKEHMPKELPIVALQKHWKATNAIMKKYKTNSMFLGWVPANIAQQTIVKNKDKLESGLAAKIVLESAFPMSKVDPVPILGHDVTH